MTVHVSEPLTAIMLRTELVARHHVDPEILDEVIASGAMRAWRVDGVEYVDAAPLLRFMRDLLARAHGTTPRVAGDADTVQPRDEETPPAATPAGSRKLGLSAPGRCPRRPEA
jgi:hypothetical protein